MSRTVACAALIGGCYQPPEFPPTVPWDAPVLVSETDAPYATCAPASNERIQCALDGDTVDVGACGGDAERIRMLGIDAPETANLGSGPDCYANQAFSELQRIVDGRVLTLSYDRECTGVFGRTLAYLWLDLEDAYARLGEDAVEDVLSLHREDVEDEPMVLLNTYLLLRGYVRRFDEAWVAPLRYDAEFAAAERNR